MGPRIGHSLSAYFKTLLVNLVLTALLYAMGFAIAGVRWWFLVGLLCGILNPIPVFGSVLALGFVLLVQLFAAEGWLPLAEAGGIWLVVQIIDGFVLSPRAAGRAGVNPFLSIFLVMAAGMLFGPLGVILAVPVTAIILIIVRTGRSAQR